ncbi:MAG: glycosyltransferase family 39 protein [bacterium]|nr:glycosyltransferase family 39 protein [bacterium]
MTKSRTLALPPLLWLLIVSVAIASIAIALNLTASIRLDEAQSIWASTKTVPGILKYIAQDVHVPLYNLLLHFWIQFFGTNVLLLRLMSLIFFVACVPAVYTLSKHASNARVARLTTSLFCLSPFLTWYSTETRMYTLLTLLSILSHFFFLKILQSNLPKNLAWYTVVGIIGLYTHYFFGIILALQTLYFIGRARSERYTWQRVLQYFTTLVVMGIALLPWMAYVFSQGGASNTKPMLAAPTSYNIMQLFVHFFTGFQSPTVQSGLISVWPIAVLLLFFTFSRKVALKLAYTDYFFFMTFAPIVLAYIVSLTIQPILVSRYLIFITPTLFYLMAIILIHFNRLIFGTIIGIVIVSNFVFQYQQALSNRIAERENYEAVAQYLSENATDGDIVVVTAPFTVYPIEYDYKGKARIDTIPLWNRYVSGSIPPYSEENLAKQIQTYQAVYNRMYVVFSYNQGYELDTKQYLDNNLERQKVQVFSPGLEVYEYQLSYL